MKKKNSLLSRTSRETPAPFPDSVDRNTDSGLVVLGIDPGTLVTGYGIVTSRSGDLRLVTSGAIRNSPDTTLSERLKRIHEEISRIIGVYRPAEFAIESAFHGKNAQSALKLGHARGVLMLAAASNSLLVSEYTPREIKKAMTGNGNASKQQIQFMVRCILKAREDRMSLDASDAIATALCHLQRLIGRKKGLKDWKSFATAHPDRVMT